MSEELFPKIAVQIPAWNQAEELIDCLNSLKEVRYENLEVIVVGSGADHASEIVKRDFPWVTLIEEGADPAFCKANHIGFRYCLEKKMDYVLLLNGDTKVFPDTISTLLTVMRGDPSIAIAGAKNILMENPDYLWGACGEAKCSPLMVVTAGRFERDEKQKHPPKDVDWIICNGCLIRADVLEKIGLFDEEGRMSNEDAEWSCRAKEHGYRTVYADEAAVLRKGSSRAHLTNRGKAFPGGYFIGRNPILFAKKSGKKHQVIKLFFMVYAGLFIRVFYQVCQLTTAMILEIFRSVGSIIMAYIRNIYPALASQKVIHSGVKDGIRGVISPELIYIEIPESAQPPASKPVKVSLPTFEQGRRVKLMRWLGY
ncbi:MAG: glycosyltransferase family 2 protein [Deltaproteobacteria bacterium]|nr:glycosyltransferase family 2 protein [Deltaproteobacteria bacterium]